MAYAPDVHVAIYQVLDEVLGAPVPPPGAKATIHSIIDDLRAAAAPDHMIQATEAISIQLHHLECAAASRDGARATRAREILRSIAVTWLDRRIRLPATFTFA